MKFSFHPLERNAFDFCMIDPPWPWVARTTAGYKKSPRYKTMTLDECAAMPVRDLLAPGGVVWLWCTWPLVGKQHLIAENAWGLSVKTGGAWSKRTRNGLLRPGTGFILRSVCEPFLICTLKNHKLKAKGAAYNLVESVEAIELEGVARENSRKPDEAYRLVETLTPGWKRADVFTRETRKGWVAFGDEKTKFDKAA